jgi:nucleoside-diphosphate-sugar epimerase
MPKETFLVTGALGCLGAWTMRHLVDEDVRVIASDLATDPIRPRLLLTEAELERITFVKADITDPKQVRALVDDHGVSHIIHLAGLQVPFCRANPVLGAQVNVVGTVNVFEAARHAQTPVQGLAYASSIAALGGPERYPNTPVPDDVRPWPETLYGAYKVANEQTARIYWQDWQVGSVGLRPYIVYGIARDQGMTSDITKAILAAVAGRPYHIKFDGLVALQSADDVARIFIESARAGYQGAAACNLRNDVVTVADFVAALKAEVPDAQLTIEPNKPLAFPADLDDSNLRHILGGRVPYTPLVTVIRDTLARFRTLLAEDRIDLAQLN